MEVEVYTRSNECEACGWWIASIKMLKPDICAVVYIGFENPYTEIVDIQRIRPKNPNPPITLKTFHQFTIPVPENLRDEWVVQFPPTNNNNNSFSIINNDDEYFSFYRAQKEGIHKDFQRIINAGICFYNSEANALIVISKWDFSQKRANMLKDMHFRNLSQKVSVVMKHSKV